MSDHIQSVERAARVIDAIRRREPSGARLSDLVADTGLQKTTTHRLLATLRHLGLVDIDEADGTAHLGLSFVSLGLIASNRHGILEVARPHLARLAELTGDTVYFSLPDGIESVCVARVTGAYPVRTLTLDVGDRRPLGLGAGSLALLAAIPEPRRHQVIAALPSVLGPWPSIDLSRISALVAETDRDGYATNHEMLIPGVSGIGVAVCDRLGSPIAAISVAAVTSRMGEDRLGQVVRWARDEAEALQAKLS